MAIDTNAEKLAILEWDEVYEPALPLSPGATPFDQGEKQNFIWGFPGVLWDAAVAPTETILDYERGWARGFGRGFALGY